MGSERTIEIERLGRMGYARAFEIQRARHASVLASRDDARAGVGRLLLVEHDPVITVSRRASGGEHLLAGPELLARHGVEVHETDRGGDITYHGPGQIVGYPIVDLNALGLRLHEYMRGLEEAVIRTVAHYGVTGVRDPGATGVWVPNGAGDPERKIAAFGVRVRKWVTMHGLALNVTTDLSHFGLIVPCGLPGRPVTTLSDETGGAVTSMDEVTERLIVSFCEVFGVQPSESS
ncbi:MAG: lipoyl(octanoyl) transferase LipB [Phycisphaerales bacterium JB040]